MIDIYFMHPSAKISAGWLHDKHVKQHLAEVENILASAIQLQTLERLPDFLIYDHPVMDWLMKSIDHVRWLAEYYQTLQDQYYEITKNHYRGWKFNVTLREYLPLFPHNGWSDPPQTVIPSDCATNNVWESYRTYYMRCKVYMGAYKRVRRPYWLDD